MTIDIIVNKADFQRHLNGCERRLNELTKSLQTIEKFSQKLLLNKLDQEQEIYFNQLNLIKSQIKYLYSSILTLEQSLFVLNGKKRLDLLKQNLEKLRIKFEHIQQYAQIKFNYDYQENQFEEITNNEEQLTKLIENNFNNEQIELDLINHRTILVDHLEKDLNDLQGTFIDLNRIIHDQGTIVNNIEQALTNTDEMIYEAKENVQTTVQRKKRSTRLKWFLICFFICFILLLIIILYFTLKLAFPYG
jgi:t-SNARE complex subunit (syntaxin)